MTRSSGSARPAVHVDDYRRRLGLVRAEPRAQPLRASLAKQGHPLRPPISSGPHRPRLCAHSSLVESVAADDDEAAADADGGTAVDARRSDPREGKGREGVALGHPVRVQGRQLTREGRPRTREGRPRTREGRPRPRPTTARLRWRPTTARLRWRPTTARLVVVCLPAYLLAQPGACSSLERLACTARSHSLTRTHSRALRVTPHQHTADRIGPPHRPATSAPTHG